MTVWRLERLFALVLTAIFVGSPLANCMTAPAQTDADMACCVTEQHDCMPGSKTADCCEKTAPESSQQFLTSAAFKAPVRQLALIAAPATGSLSAAPVAHSQIVFDAPTPPHANGPIYLAVSVLRL
jgi:hypothetical protein